MFKNLMKGLKILLIWQICNVLLLLSGLLLLVLIGGNIGGSLKKGPGSGFDEVVAVDGEVGGDDGPMILEIPLQGIIARGMDEDSFDSVGQAYRRVLEDYSKAAKDGRVRAVLLRVNSPGGSVSASDHLHESLLRFKRETGLPTYAFYEGTAASGGVYASVACDYIMAEPSCLTGSIGVIFQMMQWRELFEKVGVSENSYLSGHYKDMGSPMRDPTEKEKELFQSMVNDLYQRFVDIVVGGRGGKIERQAVLDLEGSFFLGSRAHELGLVDELGLIENCYAKIRTDLGFAKEVPVVRYRGAKPWQAWLEMLSRPKLPMWESLLPQLLRQGPWYLLPHAIGLQ